MNEYDEYTFERDNYHDSMDDHDLDNELMSQAFSDARISVQKFAYTEDDGYDDDHDRVVKSRRRKKEECKYKQGDYVLYRKHKAKIVYGPFERQSKLLCEVLLDTGVVYTAHARSLSDWTGTESKHTESKHTESK